MSLSINATINKSVKGGGKPYDTNDGAMPNLGT